MSFGRIYVISGSFHLILASHRDEECRRARILFGCGNLNLTIAPPARQPASIASASICAACPRFILRLILLRCGRGRGGGKRGTVNAAHCNRSQLPSSSRLRRDACARALAAVRLNQNPGTPHQSLPQVHLCKGRGRRLFLPLAMRSPSGAAVVSSKAVG